jgi:hypothetical protein
VYREHERLAIFDGNARAAKPFPQRTSEIKEQRRIGRKTGCKWIDGPFISKARIPKRGE